MTVNNKRGLGWLAPTPRLIIFILLSTLFTLSSEWPAVLLSLAIALALLMAGGKYPRSALLACLSAFILTFLGHALTSADPSAVSLWVFSVSGGSLLKGLRLGLRLAAMILPAIAFIAVTPLNELLESFRGLRIPKIADIYLTIVLRYVDILWYEIQISMKAMAVRGVNWQGGVADKVPAFRRLMLPLIFRILDHVDGQSLAIDNRGGLTVSPELPEIPEGVPAVAMRQVYVRYDLAEKEAAHAISDLSLEIPQNQAAVFLGRSGAGISSALLLCTGLIPKSVGHMKGDVKIFGYNTKTASLSLLGRIARIVFPSAVQGLVGLTVKDELDFSLRTSSLSPEERRQAMIAALETVGLSGAFLPRLTLGLSGGEMQRVALASAIVARPLLLALDDVTVQLDPVGKREVIAALKSLLGSKITTVISDPHIDLLAEIGDRFIIFEAGEKMDDRGALNLAEIERASLRVPQMLRLGRALGIDLPIRTPAAVEALQGWERNPVVLPQRFAETRPVLVNANRLAFTYPNGPVAIDQLDFALHEGEFVAILGSNGSGKTTLALLLAGALAPTGGEIWIGEEKFSMQRHRGTVGYVFQEPTNQIVTMKVCDELAFGPQQLGRQETDIEEAVNREMARFGLNAEDVPLHLSPANARKLAIAATLTMNPSVIILDEPTNNLDEDEIGNLMAHLKALQESGTTVVVITHDVEIACDYADRVVVMSQGKVLVDGPTRQVMAQPDVLRQSDVSVPPVVELSLGLWPGQLPALTVAELAETLQPAALHTELES